MPYDSNGNYTLPTSYFVENGDTVLPVQHNPPFEDVQVALNAALLRSGVAPMSGNLKMGGFKATNLAAGTATTDAVNKSQLDLETFRYVSKGANYTTVAADNATFMRYTGTFTHTLAPAAALAADWWQVVKADGGDVTIDADGSELINGALTLLVRDGMSCLLICAGNAFFATLLGLDPIAKWRSKAIGEVYMADTSTGADTPPQTDPEVVFVRLTAGLTGSGFYNEGKLTSESVSGSAPLVVATAVVSVSGSPMNGQTINLLNTEGRILRPSTSTGTKQNDAIQNITGTANLIHTSGDSETGVFSIAGISGTRNGSGSSNGIQLQFDASRVVRTSTETRMKNVGVMAFMRVK